MNYRLTVPGLNQNMSALDTTAAVLWPSPVAARLDQALAALAYLNEGRPAVWSGAATQGNPGVFSFFTSAAVPVSLQLTVATLAQSVLRGSVLVDTGALEGTTNRWRVATVIAIGTNLLIDGVEITTAARATQLSDLNSPTPTIGARYQLDNDTAGDGSRWLLDSGGLPVFRVSALSTVGGLGAVGTMFVETAANSGSFVWENL
jgi:hypothetical protein